MPSISFSETSSLQFKKGSFPFSIVRKLIAGNQNSEENAEQELWRYLICQRTLIEQKYNTHEYERKTSGLHAYIFNTNLFTICKRYILCRFDGWKGAVVYLYVCVCRWRSFVCVRLCVHAFVCVRACVRACASVGASVCVRLDVCACVRVRACLCSFFNQFMAAIFISKTDSTTFA